MKLSHLAWMFSRSIHKPSGSTIVPEAALQRRWNAAAAAQPAILYSVVEAPNHRLPGHVERPERVGAIIQALTAASFLGPHAKFSDQVKELPAGRVATTEEVGLVHHYFDWLKKQCEAATGAAPVAISDLGDPVCLELSTNDEFYKQVFPTSSLCHFTLLLQDGVTFLTNSSFHDALLALGASLQLVDAVVTGSRHATSSRFGQAQAQSPSTPTGFGIVRPPGHHATPDTALGYCVFNNAAVAARYAQQVHNVDRIFILDWDVHNGNGTCEAFWEDPTIFVADIHEESTVYPAPEFIPSEVEDVGAGLGTGFTCNVPFPRYSGHECMMATWRQVIVPALRRFRPDMIIVSAGYDSHVDDPFLMLQYRSDTYFTLTSEVKALADEMCEGRLLFLLEGGYDLDALGESVAETWRALIGVPSECAKKMVPQEEPLEEVMTLIDTLKQVHKLNTT